MVKLFSRGSSRTGYSMVIANRNQLVHSQKDLTQLRVQYWPMGMKDSFRGQPLQPTSSWRYSILMRREMPIGAGLSQCWRNMLHRAIVVLVARSNKPTPPKAEWRYLQPHLIFLLMPSSGRARKANFDVISPSAAIGAISTPNPYRRLDHS